MHGVFECPDRPHERPTDNAALGARGVSYQTRRSSQSFGGCLGDKLPRLPISLKLSTDLQKWTEPLRYLLHLLGEPLHAVWPRLRSPGTLLAYRQGFQHSFAPPYVESFLCQRVAIVLQLPVEQELHASGCDHKLSPRFIRNVSLLDCDRDQLQCGFEGGVSMFEKVKPKLVFGRL